MRADGRFAWSFEEKSISLLPTQMILVRVLIAKIEKSEELARCLQGVAIRGGEEGWNCIAWVREALSSLEASTSILGTSVVAWETVRHAALSYCKQKKDQHRFDGTGNFDITKVPTFDLVQQKETVE